ncbi:hypothetical protein [Nocardioides sp. LHG3406-4]|uniref:hypothetical protein n=1 Tax=Nocardioides sp. LHG3406-4 TaxID=2804575 RepID=UPI003CE67BCF
MPVSRETRSGTVRRAVGAALVASLLICVAAGAATAETEKIRDESGRALQQPPNQLVSGKLTYTTTRTVWVARVERLSKQRTRVFGSIYYADSSYLKVSTKYRQGELVATGHFYAPDQPPLAVPVEARWDLKRDRVTITLDNLLADPKPLNRRARLDVYTVTRGWMHGPHCGVTDAGDVKPCNDDYISARLRR